MTTTTLYLMRHGECIDSNILRGQVDAKISESGLASMHQAVIDEALEFDMIYSSPLSRCHGFAEQLSEQLSCPFKTELALCEMDFGAWDGKSFDLLYQQDPERLERFWQDPWLDQTLPPQGESIVDFESRVIACLLDCVQQKQGKQLLMVSHAGVIRCLMAWALGVKKNPGFYRQLVLPYASIIKLTLYHDGVGAIHPQLHWR